MSGHRNSRRDHGGFLEKPDQNSPKEMSIGLFSNTSSRYAALKTEPNFGTTFPRCLKAHITFGSGAAGTRETATKLSTRGPAEQLSVQFRLCATAVAIPDNFVGIEKITVSVFLLTRAIRKRKEQEVDFRYPTFLPWLQTPRSSGVWPKVRTRRTSPRCPVCSVPRSVKRAALAGLAVTVAIARGRSFQTRAK